MRWFRPSFWDGTIPIGCLVHRMGSSQFLCLSATINQRAHQFHSEQSRGRRIKTWQLLHSRKNNEPNQRNLSPNCPLTGARRHVQQCLIALARPQSALATGLGGRRPWPPAFCGRLTWSGAPTARPHRLKTSSNYAHGATSSAGSGSMARCPLSWSGCSGPYVDWLYSHTTGP
jgi:hypothetical protein